MSELLECVSGMGTVEEVKSLLELGTVDINFKDGLGWTVLHYCYCYIKRTDLANDAVEIIRLLIQYGADLNATDVANQCTPLMLYLFNKCPRDFLLPLLENDVDTNLVDHLGNVALYYFLENYIDNCIDTDLFKRLIPNREINSKNCNRETPLMASVRKGCNKEYIKALLSAGAELRIPYNYSILHTHSLGYKTTENDSLDVLKLLINHGADVNNLDGQGFTPLMFFLHMEYSSIDHVSTYINKGADVHVIDRQGNSVLHKAIYSADLCQVFLDCGVDPNRINSQQETPLMIAMGRNLRETCDSINMLITYGAVIDKNFIMLTSNKVTKEIVKLSCSMLMSHYLMNNCEQTDTRYENIFKHVFLNDPSVFREVLYSRYMKFSKLRKFVVNLYQEVERMKIYYIKSNVTLSDFFLEEKLKKYISHFQDSDDVSVDLLKDNFPQFSGILESKIEFARRWTDMYNSLEGLLISNIPSEESEKEVMLNTYCVQHLLQFLNVYHKRKLIDAKTHIQEVVP